MAPAAVAQGLLTFAFTDIVGSTRLWERVPQAAHQALARHNAIVERCVLDEHGSVFKTVGDACCCVFGDPAEAVRAAASIQRAIAGEAWPAEIGELRVRIGIHTGEAIAEQNDYFGPTLNRVARLMSAAHGGQILISAVTAKLVEHALAADCGLADLGAHRLKDLAEPQHLYQLLAPELPAEFPAPATLDAQPNNLPSQLSSFVGRESELRRIRELLAQERLVTVSGVGGIGKTRLALQVAADTIGTYADGSWIVRLADVTDGALAAGAIASALHAHGTPGQPLEETLVQHIESKAMLLLLDNAEHIVAQTAGVVRRLLNACPNLRILVTSREPLHVAGERVVRIGPLVVHDAEALFLSRADLAVADRYVTHICDELDGLPLAIELAAGRIGTLSTKQLDARLHTMLPVLVSKDRSQEDRHRTLQATIEWSYRLLNPKEQRFFSQLAVFEGGFTLEACEAVAWAGEEDDPAYELLDALVDKSFVTAEPAGDAMRYRLLEALREFACGKLVRCGEADAAHQQHFTYFSQRSELWGTWESAEEERRYLDEIAVEMPNLRAALDWGLGRPNREPAMEMLINVGLYWQQHCSIAEARAWLRRACDGAPHTLLHAKLLRRAATFATIEDDYAAARELTARALAMFQELDERPGTAEALHNLAVIEQRSGSEERAYALYAQALAMFEETHHEVGVITALYNLAQTAKQRGEIEAAQAYLERGMSLCVSAQHADRLATFWTLRGELAMQQRAFDTAADALSRSLEMKRALDDRHDQTEVLCNLAVLALRKGEMQAALGHAREALSVARDLNVPSLVIGCFEVFAALLLETGQSERAREVLALAKAIREKLGYVYEIMSELTLDLAVLGDVAPAADTSQETLARTIDELTGIGYLT